ncbi:dipeptide ABC transporter ATP-binding protein [Ruegeria sp. 2012CJ41-6]|uniref:Dipeptide ABC transporter ATP-binding protein n=1 Tax=Ruegeria spongiae TaxID=2942209 RepID=A0ABT0Q877_9RHOB|nr:dipeptide ABC transporter ATP-binding protein [Ruegeria spongiae]MCL6286086.1 dipeptide ABC transporter ATP-binding protein [Ruegeria spongiae]
MTAHQPEPLRLHVRDLKKHYPIRTGVFSRVTNHVRAVDGISFDLRAGETLAIVGESGCGKSTAGQTILRLLRPTSGLIELSGEDISDCGERTLRPLRQKMQMIFQDPYASLNPRKTIGAAVAEPLTTHRIASGSELTDRVEQLFEKVGLRPEQMSGYPHQFSGGQRQRVAIARAIAVQPSLVICDEPVSALDISIQAQIINLMMDIQADIDLSLLFISHDLAVVELIADRIAVMYLGVFAEVGTKEEIFRNPQHPYTKALLSAVPLPDPKLRSREKIVLAGDVPSPSNPPSGCRFHTRCPLAKDKCRNIVPPLRTGKTGHAVACHLVEGF